jgi:hypothetical protein
MFAKACPAAVVLMCKCHISWAANRRPYGVGYVGEG